MLQSSLSLDVGMVQFQKFVNTENRELKQVMFLSHGSATGSELFLYLTCLCTATFVVLKYLSTSSGNYYENLGELSVQACEMFTCGICPWLKNIACLSALL